MTKTAKHPVLSPSSQGPSSDHPYVYAWLFPDVILQAEMIAGDRWRPRSRRQGRGLIAAVERRELVQR
jgi:hypothetical protein